jgi:uncharacterized membrane protein
MEERIDDEIFTAATVLYLPFLPLYPITASLMGEVTSNTVIAVATVANVLVAMVYAFFTWGLGRETRVAADAATKSADASVESAAVARQYTDIFTGTQRHTEICASVVVDPQMAGKAHPFRFPGYPKHNSHT